MHRTKRVAGEQLSAQMVVAQQRFLGLREVLQSSSYSLVLSAAALLKKEYLQVSRATHPAKRLVIVMVLLQEFYQSPAVTELLASHPHCHDLAIPVFAASIKAPAPIFVAVDVSVRAGVRLSPYSSVLRNLQVLAAQGATPPDKTSTVSASKQHLKGSGAQQALSDDQKGECVSLAMHALKMDRLPVATHKTVVAGNQWIW